MTRRFPLLFVAALAASLSPMSASAQTGYGPSQFEISPLIALARELGRVAGNAEFCGYDEEIIEDFIVRAFARLAREAKDDILLAGGRVEFNSHAAFGRARGPEEPCESYAITFASYRGAVGRTGGGPSPKAGSQP